MFDRHAFTPNVTPASVSTMTVITSSAAGEKPMILTERPLAVVVRVDHDPLWIKQGLIGLRWRHPVPLDDVVTTV